MILNLYGNKNEDRSIYKEIKNIRFALTVDHVSL